MKRRPNGTFEKTPAKLRFFEKFSQKAEDECWPWLGRLDRDGYGRFRMSESEGCVRSNQASWIFFRGEIPMGQWVLHRCDNPRCVNPAHLFLGNAKDNKVDSMSKGRHARGTKLPWAKLNEQQVIEIIDLSREKRYGLRAELARQFNVDWSTIDGVLTGHTWKHVTNQNKLNLGDVP